MKRLLLALAMALSITAAHATNYSLWYPGSITVSTWTPTFSSTIATEVQFLNAGTVTGLAFYKSASDTTTSRNLVLWANNGPSSIGQNEAECTTSSEPTGTAQWITCTLTTAFPVSAGSNYYVSYDLPPGTNFGIFSSGGNGCNQVASNTQLGCTGAAQDRNLTTYPATPGQLAETNTVFADVIFTPCP